MATPEALVEALGAPRRVAPPGAVAVTLTPAWVTALPKASRSATAGCWANTTPLCAAPLGSVTTSRRAAAPGAAVAVKLTGLPPSGAPPAPVAAALTALAPAVVPRVHAARVATPCALVATDAVGPEPVPSETVPPPCATEKVTVTPCTGLPFWSVTFTDGGAATAWPTIPFWLAADCPARVVGCAAPPMAVNVTCGSPLTAAVRVLGPATGERVQ